MTFLNVYTNLSTSPLVDGWCGVQWTCFMWFSLRKCWKTSVVNWVLLSDANYLGKPWVANTLLGSTIFFVVVVVITGITSGHFEWPSTIIRNDVLKNKPAKSLCRHCDGYVGQVHEWRTAGASLFLKHWQDSHFLTISSIYFSTPGHQTCDLA